jgi:hypothetical protein
MASFVAILGVLVAAGVLGFGGYLAAAADFLIWLLVAGLVVVVGRGVKPGGDTAIRAVPPETQDL